jgi:plasmid maintenance system killer protein
MIQSFGDKDTEALFNRERVKKIPPDLLQRNRSKLLIINAAVITDYH